jgi:hypothetical protein
MYEALGCQAQLPDYTSKDPGPEDPALISPQRGGVYLRLRMEYWNGGIMEYWESKADDSLILYSAPCHPNKNRSNSAKPSIPTFQYSIIPWHMFTA